MNISFSYCSFVSQLLFKGSIGGVFSLYFFFPVFAQQIYTDRTIYALLCNAMLFICIKRIYLFCVKYMLLLVFFLHVPCIFICLFIMQVPHRKQSSFYYLNSIFHNNKNSKARREEVTKSKIEQHNSPFSWAFETRRKEKKRKEETKCTNEMHQCQLYYINISVVAKQQYAKFRSEPMNQRLPKRIYTDHFQELLMKE